MNGCGVGTLRTRSLRVGSMQASIELACCSYGRFQCHMMTMTAALSPSSTWFWSCSKTGSRGWPLIRKMPLVERTLSIN
jgi:hypothetical protein